MRATASSEKPSYEYDPEEAEAFLYHDRLAFSEGLSETEETIKFPDGKTRTLHTKKMRFEHDRETYILGIGRDITELKETEKGSIFSLSIPIKTD